MPQTWNRIAQSTSANVIRPMPAPDTAKRGGAGIIRTGTVWDGNSLQKALIDPQVVDVGGVG